MKRKEDQLYSVRVETWNSRGWNLGWQRRYLWWVNLDEAIEEARTMFKTILPEHRDKQLKIFKGNKLVWQYYNNETKRFPEEAPKQ